MLCGIIPGPRNPRTPQVLTMLKPTYYLFKVMKNIPRQVKARKIARLNRRKERMELEFGIGVGVGFGH
jgi:hypothetical protein